MNVNGWMVQFCWSGVVWGTCPWSVYRWSWSVCCQPGEAESSTGRDVKQCTIDGFSRQMCFRYLKKGPPEMKSVWRFWFLVSYFLFYFGVLSSCVLLSLSASCSPVFGFPPEFLCSSPLGTALFPESLNTHLILVSSVWISTCFHPVLPCPSPRPRSWCVPAVSDLFSHGFSGLSSVYRPPFIFFPSDFPFPVFCKRLFFNSMT